MYIDTIKNDLSRTTKLITDENSTSPNEDSFFSSNNSIFTTSDECKINATQSNSKQTTV